MASPLHGYRITQALMTVRFVHGYRYLDRCGEALIRLEESLDESWIPAKVSPDGGGIKSDLQSMTASFDSGHLTVGWFDSVGSLDEFRDAALTIYETLVSTLDIPRILSPAVLLIAQKGKETIEEAERGVLELGLAQAGTKVQKLLGEITNAKVTWISECENKELDETPVKVRTRVEGGAIIQTPQPGFDERLLRRARTLGERQREAMDLLRKLRLEVPKVPAFAIQLQVERSVEEEMRESTFNMPVFLEKAWNWNYEAIAALTGSTEG